MPDKLGWQDGMEPNGDILEGYNRCVDESKANIEKAFGEGK
jgi:hypothetical protein